MISIRLENSLESQLAFYSNQHHISKSKLIKNALVYYFDMLKNENKSKSSYDIGAELFGKYGSGDGELSTTYKQRLKGKINAKNSH